MPSSKPVVSVLMDPEFLEEVDDFRFAHRFSTRSAAIVWLLRWALDHYPEQEAAGRHDRDSARRRAAV